MQVILKTKTWKFKLKDCIICKKPFKPYNGAHIACSKICQLNNRRKHYSKWGKKYKRNLRKRVIKEYGNKCNCCGEDQYEFLCLDHVNNDGAKHRKELTITYKKNKKRSSNSLELCLWIIKNDFPNTIQVLCYNCNSAKGFYGHCPHTI